VVSPVRDNGHGDVVALADREISQASFGFLKLKSMFHFVDKQSSPSCRAVR
jgi:hypothetical protein